MVYYNDSTDTKSSKSSGIDLYEFSLGDEEKEELKWMTPASAEYIGLKQKAFEVGSHIIRPDMSIMMDTASANQSGLTAVQKLKRSIYYAYHQNPRLGRDAFIFDMWVAGVLGHKHKINVLTKDIELDGKVIDPEDLYHDSWMTYRRALGLEPTTPKEQFISLLLNHLRNAKVNPWLELMKKVGTVTPEQFMAKHGFDPHRMCEFLTGDDRELQQFLWLVQFIGVMARTHKPGCQHDHLLVLMSAEKGQRKTSLLRAIAKDPETTEQTSKFYVQLKTLKSDKKDVERLRGKIIVNLDECDAAFRGTNSDDLKEAITSTSDNYRASYGRTAKDWDRTCVLFGTTNTTGLLQDYSGDRRIFIIHVRKQIDTDWVTNNWCDFWGFYKWAYKQMEEGNHTYYRNWLNKTEEALLVVCQSEYKAREPWLDTLDGVMSLLEQKHTSVAVKASDILAVIGCEIESKKRYIADHIKDYLMSERGYKEGRPRPDNAKQPSKNVLYLPDSKGSKPYLVSRKDIQEAYSGYLQGVEDYPAYRQKVEASPEITDVNISSVLPVVGLLPQVTPETLTPIAPLVQTSLDEDCDDIPF